VREGRVTLVYGSRDEKHNAAVALRKFLAGEAAAGLKRAHPPSRTPIVRCCHATVRGRLAPYRPDSYSHRNVRLRRTTHADNIQRFSGW